MTVKLSLETRTFLWHVAALIFQNPFSAERRSSDARLVPHASGEPWPDVVDHLIVELERHLPDAPTMVQLETQDREVAELAALFLLFHRYADGFDQHIDDQLAAGADPQRLAFGPSFRADLARYGFDDDRASHYIALSFQLRRAFRFIQNSLVGASPSMERFRRALWNNVFTHDFDLYARLLWRNMDDFSTLLIGPTGSGKGTAAAAIGRSGYIAYDCRRDCFAESFVQAFVSVNLSQFPASLVEAELFGHKKGAFTGAIDSRPGLLMQCSSSGAIFLDEIGELDPTIQIKLLTVLQERTFRSVGSSKVQRFSGRVIAATNQSLPDLRGRGRFRDDFYYRLCSDVIEVPSLAQRAAENPHELDILVSSVLHHIVGDHSEALASAICEILRDCVGPEYGWPGNVRELEQAVRRILITRQYRPEVADAPTDENPLLAATEDGRATAEQLLARYCRCLYDRLGTYEAVARRVQLDRRTVKRYLDLQTSLSE